MPRIAYRELAALALLAVLAATLPGRATLAQSKAASGAAQVPRPDELEPGVDTSRSVPAAPAASPGASAAAAPPPSPPPPAAAPQTAAAAGAAPAKGAPAAGKGTKKGGPDRLELDATQVTGNSELPKVLYIVPWKRSDLGDMVGRPVNSLLDEVLQPLDRDVFKRENRYYDALQPGAEAAK